MEVSAIYIYERTPLILLFATGYLLYLVMSGAGLPGYMAARAVRFSRGRADALLLSLIAVSAGLSMFIPNAVTVLAMLPVIRRLAEKSPDLTTPLTLSIIYGANIGGMGSLIGSPANMLLIGVLDYFDVPGRGEISFFNWFEWALPLVLLFLVVAWRVACVALNDRKMRFYTEEIAVLPFRPSHARGLAVLAVYIGYWLLSSIAAEFSPVLRKYEPLGAGIFTLLFCGYVFGTGLVRPRDLIHRLPKRGIVLLGALGLLLVLAGFFRLDEHAADGFSLLLKYIEQDGCGGFTVYLAVAFAVIMLTEFLSNTVVSTAFFAVVVHMAGICALEQLPLLILVSTASTCAFMTPVATPCNSLAVGEMRGVSLRAMLLLGMLLNVVGAFLLSIWIREVVPLVYG
ncbi:SLC13 family permease [Maridesulfovibrio sp.]|uniref:SLC13 family permease n=1 Tax=Maridesulfovibrio sp. TaxID=2795000 RepID=UPI002A18ADC6|nr:SLC13 family permease [Maridesulfovibrio sp.]